MYFADYCTIRLTSLAKQQIGFTLIELLIALVIASLLLAGVYDFYISQSKVHSVREEVAAMHQNARIGMALMTRELRMAGYDPSGNAGAGIVTATQHAIRITIDLNEDEDVLDENEDITYSLYDSGNDGDLDLGRKPGGGSRDPAAENFERLELTYTLADGSTSTAPIDVSQIRMIHITMTARTAKPDPTYPQNGGYRTYTLRSIITPRNLGS